MVLEALRGFDEARLVAAAPLVHRLVAGLELKGDRQLPDGPPGEG